MKFLKTFKIMICSKIVSRNQYPDSKVSKVRGICFSPPGCILSENLVSVAKKCVKSFFVRDDIVPRLAFNAWNYYLLICAK